MKMKQYLALTFFSLVLATGSFAEIKEAGIKVKWGYTGNIGPERWGLLSNDFAACSVGKEQSPINIVTQEPLISPSLSIHYTPSPLYVLDDGATDLLIGQDHVLVNTGHGVQVNFHADTHETIMINNKSYRLVQFHFHSPSENLLNKQSFPLEIHFVHQSDDGHVAVIGVFVKAGDSNPALQTIVSALPVEEGVEKTIANTTINPADLLPATNAYYSFNGSLTTPPCTEGLQWIVLQTPIVASPAQIAIIRKESGGMNARPVQPLNHRKIYRTASLNKSNKNEIS